MLLGFGVMMGLAIAGMVAALYALGLSVAIVAGGSAIVVGVLLYCCMQIRQRNRCA